MGSRDWGAECLECGPGLGFFSDIGVGCSLKGWDILRWVVTVIGAL